MSELFLERDLTASNNLTPYVSNNTIKGKSKTVTRPYSNTKVLHSANSTIYSTLALFLDLLS